MVKIYLIFLTCFPPWVRLQGIDFPFASFPACRRDPGKNGWCRDIKDCPPILGNILNIKRSNCGFRGDRPLVCCPLSVDLLKSNKESGVALLKEKLLSPIRSFECGRREVVEPESISDGRKSHATISLPLTASHLQTSLPSSSNPTRTVPHFKSWPWMVLLVENNESNGKTFFCSGVLINENYVLTAAECLVNRTDLFVRFRGHHNKSKEFNSEPFDNSEDIKVEDSILHPNYRVNKNYHGLALLKLSKRQVTRDGVIPICLPLDSESQDLVNETVTLISWARDHVDEQPFPLLLEDNATVLDFSVCKESFSDRSDNEEFFLDKMNNDSVLCLDYDAAKDFCKGTSGGPVMHYRQRDETFTLSGIISTDYGCRSKTLPRIYTSIRNRSTMMWIRDVALT